MEGRSTATPEKIQQMTLAGFLDKEFLGAPLRQIVKNTGVTTGVFYGCFSSKEALFDFIMEPHTAAFMGRFVEAQATFTEPPEKEQSEYMSLESGRCVDRIVDYICARRGSVRLLLCCAGGASYEHLVYNMVGVEVEYIQRYMEASHRLGRDIPVLDKFLYHIIASGMFNDISEIVVHDIPRDQTMWDMD